MTTKHHYQRLPVLIVDDEVESLDTTESALRSGGINNIHRLTSPLEVLPYLDRETVGVVLLDLNMPAMRGEDLLEQLNEQHPEIPVIVVTGSNSIETAVHCMRMGAFDYMVKAVERTRLVSGVSRALRMRILLEHNEALRKRLMHPVVNHPEAFERIITNHESMIAIFSYVEAVSATQEPVLILGETGSGKELIAQCIHDLSGQTGEFVAVNVAGLDEHTFSDTLFGHRKGAFTGAQEKRDGLVKRAKEGTLFLDEIGDLAPEAQVKLLRLLQEREYYPLGSDVAVRSNARLVVATNQDLADLREQGRFRADLYYRLRTHRVELPPLRKRKSDLPILLDHFLERSAQALQRPKPTAPPQLLSLLAQYSFPGNIREFEGMVFDAVSRHRGGVLSMKVFEEHTGRPSNSTAQGDGRRDAMRPFEGLDPLPGLKEVGDLLVEEAIRRAEGNQSLAARMLRVSQPALSRRFKRKDEGAGE